jgi:hypothetical protein
MPVFEQATLAMYMQKARERLEAYDSVMHPWIKDNSKRASIFKAAQKNSELYLEKSDNSSGARITMESIFDKLTRGQKFGGR